MSPSWLRHRTLTPALRAFESRHPSQKIREPCSRIFLSKPQAWHIIRRKAVYHQPSGLYIITRQRVSFLRLDDMQCFALMRYRNKLRMRYMPSA